MKTKMLKRIAMLAVIAFSYLNAWAYEPMYVEGKKWSFRYVDKHFGDLLKQICYEVAGDTVIGGKTIKIIREWGILGVHAYERLHDLPEISKPYVRTLLRYEDKGKVYAYENGSLRLLMDFDSPVNTVYNYHFDEIDGIPYNPADIEYRIENCDTVNIHGKALKRVSVISKMDPAMRITSYMENNKVVSNHVWIEGVGPLDSREMMSLDPSDRYSLEFDLCIFSDDTYVDREAYIQLPAASIEGVEADGATDDAKIYDLEGRRVEHPVEGHIYIRDGKKFVWKE